MLKVRPNVRDLNDGLLMGSSVVVLFITHETASFPGLSVASFQVDHY